MRKTALALALLLIAIDASAEPLIRARLSRRAIERALTQYRRYQEPVRDEILGAQVAGSSQNNLTISPRLLPSENSLRIELELVGDVRANTASRKSAATVRSVSSTTIRGQKLIDFNLDRTVVHPAKMSAATDSQIVDFSWGRILGKSIARRQASDSKAASEAISARKAAARAATRFDREVNPQIRNATREVRGRLSALPKSLGLDAYSTLRTRPEYLELLVHPRVQAPSTMLVAPMTSAAPQSDFLLEVSETFFEEAVASRLGGKTLSSDALDEWRSSLFAQLEANIAPESAISNTQSWSVTFANPPLECSATMNSLKLRIRVQSMTRGDDTLPPMDIEAIYRVEHQQSSRGDRWVLRRDERLNVDLGERQAGKARRGVRTQVLRSTARSRLSPLIPAEISLNELVPQNFGKLASRIRFRDGAVSIRDGRVIISANQ